MTVTYIEHPEADYVEVQVDGRIGQADIDRVMPQLKAFMQARPRIGVLEVVRSLSFVNVPAALPHMGLGIAALTKVRRVALVTDLIWLTQLSRVAAIASPMQIQVFGLTEEASARAWVQSMP